MSLQPDSPAGIEMTSLLLEPELCQRVKHGNPTGLKSILGVVPSDKQGAVGSDFPGHLVVVDCIAYEKGLARAKTQLFNQADSLVDFAVCTMGGILTVKIMNKFLKEKVNPLIGAAGVSAVPMAARVVQMEGIKYDKTNHMLMHAVGPNLAGVIGSAAAAGMFIAMFD